MEQKVRAEGSATSKRAKVVSDPFIFHWQVNGAGYQWARDNADDQPHLVACPGKGKDYKEPFSLRDAFLEFSRLDSPESIQEFANKYGDLYPGHDGTSLRHWRREIGDMRVLFQLWRDIKNRKLKKLREVIQWETKAGQTFVSYRISTPVRKSDTVLSHPAVGGWGNKHFRQGDILLPARCALQNEINVRLERHPTVPRLNWTPDSLQTTGGYYQRMIYAPPHLLAAMWLSFAQAVTEDLTIRVCFCGKPFQVGPGSGKRADCEYHDDICRVRAWAARKQP